MPPEPGSRLPVWPWSSCWVSPGMMGCCLHPRAGGLRPSSPRSLMKAMEQRVEALGAEPHGGMSEATTQMLQESIIRGRSNSYSRDLPKEDSRFQEITRDLEIRADLLENREEEMARAGPRQHRHGRRSRVGRQ